MPTIIQDLAQINEINKGFTGTVAFKNEKISLPDGSKVAIGIDGPQWVIIYQQRLNSPFIVYEFNAENRKILVDKHPGGPGDYQRLKGIIGYFFGNADVQDLVTIEARKHSI